MMKNPKNWLAIILVALIMIFALLNMELISVNFLGFGFETRRVLLIFICVIIGFVLGKTIRFKRS